MLLINPLKCVPNAFSPSLCTKILKENNSCFSLTSLWSEDLCPLNHGSNPVSQGLAAEVGICEVMQKDFFWMGLEHWSKSQTLYLLTARLGWNQTIYEAECSPHETPDPLLSCSGLSNSQNSEKYISVGFKSCNLWHFILEVHVI